MRWLLHGIGPGGEEAMRRHGHQTQRPEEAGLGEGADAGQVLETARQRQLDILTSDLDLAAAALAWSAGRGRRIVLLETGAGSNEAESAAVDRLFERYPRPGPGRLYRVMARRVKVRQLRGNQ